MHIPYWLLRLLPMWDYICPKCRREVKRKSRKCPYCGENYGIPLRVPPQVLKDPKTLEDYVHKHIFPKISASERKYLTQFFTVEEVYTNSFDSTYVAWTEFGASPYLQNTDADYVYTGTGATKEGDWGFPTASLAGTINSVKLRFEARTSILECGDVTIEVWDGSSWVNAGYIGVYGTVYAWYEKDVTSILDSWSKINGAKVRLTYEKWVAGNCYVRRLTRKVDGTVIFSDGFESGDYSAWTGAQRNGVHAIISTDSHHGVYCDHCAGTGTFQDWSGDVYKDIGNYDTVYVRDYVKFVVLPASGQYFEINDLRVAFTLLGILRITNSAGTMQLSIRSSEGGTTTQNYAFVTGTWYCIEFARYKDATAGWYRAYINGNLVVQQTALNTSANYATRIFFGVTYSGSAGVNADIHQDCCVIADTYIGLEGEAPPPSAGILVQVI
jgi:hypothetical protein